MILATWADNRFEPESISRIPEPLSRIPLRAFQFTRMEVRLSTAVVENFFGNCAVVFDVSSRRLNKDEELMVSVTVTGLELPFLEREVIALRL